MRRLPVGLLAFMIVASGIAYPLLSAPQAIASEDEKKAAPGDPVYVDLSPMALPLIEGDHVSQVLQFTITFEVPDEAAAKHIADVKPRLTDAYIQDLYGALERRQLMDGRVLDVSRLRNELARISTGVLGENAFRAILIQKISQRMM